MINHGVDRAGFPSCIELIAIRMDLIGLTQLMIPGTTGLTDDVQLSEKFRVSIGQIDAIIEQPGEGRVESCRE